MGIEADGADGDEAGRLAAAHPPTIRLPALLLVAATLCLVAAGLLLWWRRGAAVFSDLALSALALCF